MEPGPACWMILSFLSGRRGKASAWILSEVPGKQGKRRKKGKMSNHVRSGGFLFKKSLFCDIRIPTTMTRALYSG